MPSADTVPAVDLGAAPQLIIAVLLSTAVVSAIITALTQLIINRGNRKLAERKDVREGESEQVGRYRAMADQAGLLAEQARKSAETAVAVIQHSLESTQTLVLNLQATVNSQNETIRTMAQAAGIAASDLQRMTDDRDRTQQALDAAQRLQDEQQDRRDQLERERAELADTGPAPIIRNPRRTTR